MCVASVGRASLPPICLVSKPSLSSMPVVPTTANIQPASQPAPQTTPLLPLISRGILLQREAMNPPQQWTLPKFPSKNSKLCKIKGRKKPPSLPVPSELHPRKPTGFGMLLFSPAPVEISEICKGSAPDQKFPIPAAPRSRFQLVMVLFPLA